MCFKNGPNYYPFAQGTSNSEIGVHVLSEIIPFFCLSNSFKTIAVTHFTFTGALRILTICYTHLAYTFAKVINDEGKA